MKNYGVIESINSPFAQEAVETASNRYSFIPTTRVIDRIIRNGWKPVQASESHIRSTKSIRQGYQKHLIKFQNPKLSVIKADGKETLVQLLLKNAHDTSACFEILAGLFVVLCTNGLVVADSMMGKYRVHHLGYTEEKVDKAVNDILERIPAVSKRIKDYTKIEMTEDEREKYALNALSIKYDQDAINNGMYDIGYLLEPRRKQDESPTLWNTYNTVQEKLLNGGNFTYNKFGTLIQSRPVKAIDTNIEINKALWELTEEFAKRRN